MPKQKTASKEVFQTDLDFCPRCGTVLPLPGLEDVVLCKLCSFKIDVNGKKISLHIKTNIESTMANIAFKV